MNKHAFFILLMSLSLISVSAQRINVTDSTRISLLTCSPGPAGYEKFGHTGIRIADSLQGVDLVANWGIFDFDKPGFYYKFVRGETYYMLGIYSTDIFVNSYRERNSSVSEQIINLTSSQKQLLLDKIMTNYEPQNREYLYNFVFDNCATRPLDLIVQTYISERIAFRGDYTEKTYREWIAHFADKNSWLMFGIDLVFGKDADKAAPREKAVFLPEVLEAQLDGAKVMTSDNREMNLIAKKLILISKTEVEEKKNFFATPLFLLIVVVLLMLSIGYWERKSKKNYRIIDFLLHFIAGVAGLIIFYLMFFSIHPLVKSNFNLLWCNPISLLTAVLILVNRSGKLTAMLQVLHVILLLFSIVVFVTQIQVMNTAFLPLITLMLFRALIYLKHNRLSRSQVK